MKQQNFNILIVGCGNIGFRHFQSILNINKKLNIYLYDKNDTQFIKFKKFYKKKSNDKNAKIYFLNNLNKKLNIFCSIISTTLPNRYYLIEKIIQKSEVKFFIIEKIPFFNLYEFKKCINILKKNNIKAWVNCPNRVFKSYKNLKKNLNGKKVNMIINGGNWGLISNAIHYIDLFNFLNDNIKLKETNITGFKTVQSNRKYFQELKSSIIFNYDKCFLALNDTLKYNIPVTLQIYNNYNKFYIYENENYLINFSENIIKNRKFKIELQSNLTEKYILDLIKKSHCDLSSLDDCYEYYFPFIKLINSKIKEYKIKKLKIT